MAGGISKKDNQMVWVLSGRKRAYGAQASGRSFSYSCQNGFEQSRKAPPKVNDLTARARSFTFGAGGRTRTYEDLRREIYSLMSLPLDDSGE